MSDLVERLRAHAKDFAVPNYDYAHEHISWEAADRITKLEAENRALDEELHAAFQNAEMFAETLERVRKWAAPLSATHLHLFPPEILKIIGGVARD